MQSSTQTGHWLAARRGAESGSVPRAREVPRWRWLAAFLAGAVLYVVAKVLASVGTAVVFGGAEPSSGLPLALVGVLRVPLVLAAMALAIRVAGGRLGDLGLTAANWRRDVPLGAAVGLGWALLDIAVIIPLTGGAERSDVVESLALMGTGVWGFVGLLVSGLLAGGFAEELFFRGHIIHTLRNLGGRGTLAVVVAVLFSAAYFGLAHRYQGWAGAIAAGIEGAIYAALYLWRGRLTAAMVAHGAYNAVAVVALRAFYS